MKFGKSFPPDEDARITAMYMDGEPLQSIADATGRTYHGIESRVRKLGLRRNRPPNSAPRAGMWWTDEERRVLRENSAAPMAHLLELLPGRTRGSIYEQLSRLGGNEEREFSRPLHTPFETSSGARAIRTKRGVIPYVPTIHDHLIGTL